jgi:hypothetical protein
MKRQSRNAFCVTITILAVILACWPLTAHAQSAIAVTQNEHEHVFGESVTFRLAVTSNSQIEGIRLFYRVSGQTSAHKAVLEFEPDTAIEVEHTEDMRDETNYQPPMITFTYWWLIEDKAGNRLKTDPISFVYEDTDYTWQVLEDDLVHLYWHDQDQDFGQHFFDMAVEAAAALSDEFGVHSMDPVTIVIYNSHQELMAVLIEASSEWTGAVTFGETGCIAIGLGPMSWMDQVIPHELTHAVLYMITKPPFGNIPRWLHEGLAVRSEGGMGAEERIALAEAIKEDTLISLRVLNSSFPDQRDQAILSYAESSSLIDFIIEAYGKEKLGQLIATFAEGAHYDDAMVEIFGVDMDGMEDLWRAHIGAQPRSGITRATPVPSPTFTVQPEPSPTRKADTVTITPPRETEPTVTATATATPLPGGTQPVTPPTPSRGSRGPCLGLVPALALLVLFVAFRPRSR